MATAVLPSHTEAADASRRWTLALTSVASAMVALDMLAVSTALAPIRRDLDASMATLEWTVNAYNLTFAVLLLTATAVGDRFGRRRVFVAGVGLFTAASAGCALAPAAGWLVLARTVQGVGAAIVLPLALALLSAAFPAARRGRALGVFGGVIGIAVAAGPLVGGAVTEGMSWSWIFWLNLPVGVAVIALARRRIPESCGPHTRLDLPGVALVTAGGFGVVWGLVRGNDAGWVSAEIVAALGGGSLLVAAFVEWERRARTPMLPMRLFACRAFAVGNASTFLLYASHFGTIFFLAQFLQTAVGHDPLDAGLRLVPWTLTPLLVSPVAGTLADRFGERPFLVFGLLMQAVGMAWIATVADPDVAYAELVGPLVVSGCGVSMAIPAAQRSVVTAVAADAVGKAAGINTMMRQLGGVLGIAVLVAIFTGVGSDASATAFTEGFRAAMAGSAGIALAGATVALGLSGATAITHGTERTSTGPGTSAVATG